MQTLAKMVPNEPVMGSRVRGAVLMVARRPLNAGAIMFERLPAQSMPFVSVDPGAPPLASISVSGLTQVDGEYVVLVASPDDDSIFDTQAQRATVRQAVTQ